MQTIHKHESYSFEIPDFGQYLDIDNLKSIVTRSGSHFFDRDTMRFFKSRVDAYTFTGPDGWYFVTSEKHESAFARINEPRLYTVRCLRVVHDEGNRPTLRLVELEGFQAYPTLNRARTAARKAAKTPRSLCPSCHLRLNADDDQMTCTECSARHDRQMEAAVNEGRI